MTVLKIQNCYSWLLTDNEKIKSVLWKLLRVREKDYFHSPAYKAKRWDGYTEYFKQNTGRFPTGLLTEIKEALAVFQVPYEIADQRKFFTCGPEIDKTASLQWGLGYELHDYQVEYVNQIIKYHRGIVQAPTGAGKTNILIGIVKAIPPKVPVLILANKKGLCAQNYDALTEAGVQNVGKVWGKYGSPNMITCATVQSMHKMAKLLPHIGALIVDEVHEMMSPQPKAIYNKLINASMRVGISATPLKWGGLDKSQKYDIRGCFGPIMEIDSAQGVLTTKQLQERRILSTSNCIFYPITEPQIPYDVYMDAVTNGIAESWYFHNVVTRLAKRMKGRTLIIVERIAHGDALASLLPGSLWVRGKDDEDTRKYVIGQLKTSKEDVIAIATQGIFNTGINVIVQNLLNCCGGKAEHQIIQRMGRGLRVSEDKQMLNYYDFIFKINDYLYRHSLKRVKILEGEGHQVTIKDEIDF